jgi:hypothetical protein
MSKKPIAWHEECLKNRIHFYTNKRRVAMQDLASCDKGDASIKVLERQIAEAIRQGKPDFDAERFLVRKDNQ